MVKRCVINFSQATPKIRISAPTYDVDTAPLDKLLLHEDMLSAKIHQITYVTNPVSLTVPAVVTISPALPFAPFCFGYILTGQSVFFPHRLLPYNDGASVAGSQPLQMKSTTNQVQVYIPNTSTIAGAYVVIYRYPSGL